MVLESSFFLKHLDMFMGYIRNDQNDKKKNPQVIVAIKCLFDCCLVNNYMIEPLEIRIEE